MIRRTIWTALFCSIVVCVVSRAEPADDPKPTTAPDPVTAWYDVADLLRPVIDAPPRGADDDPNKNCAGRPVADPGMTSDSLSKLIQDSVDSGSWRNNGGSDGELTTVGHSLMIVQTPENQRKIEDLFKHMREQTAHAEQIGVEAYWLRLKPGQLKSGSNTIDPALLTAADTLIAEARAIGSNGQPLNVTLDRTFAAPTTAPADQPGPIPARSHLSLAVTATHGPGDPVVRVAFKAALYTAPDPAGTVFAGSATMQSGTVVCLRPGTPAVVSAGSDKPGSSDVRTFCLVLCATIQSPGK